MLVFKKMVANVVNFFLEPLLIVKKRVMDFHKKRVSPLGVFGKYLAISSVLIVVLIYLFLKLGHDLAENELKLMDQAIINAVNLFHSTILTRVMIMVSKMGAPLTLAILGTVTYFFLLKSKRFFWESTMVLISLLGSWGMNEFLKWFFHRARPHELRLVEVSGYSFPSGHAMVSAAFYGILIYLAWINLDSKAYKFLITLFLALLILAIGISRIYLGVHYPSDVLAGFLAGTAWLTGCALGLQALKKYRPR